MRHPSAAFEAFVGEHYESVARVLSVAFRDPVVAEESTREAFARAYAQWTRVRRSPRPVTWVYVTACRNALRRARTEIVSASEPGSAERAIDELSVRQRLALLLDHIGLLTDEVAGSLRCSGGQAAATLREAHRRLGVERDDYDDLPEVQPDAP